MLFMLQTNIYKENKATFKFNRFSHQIIRFFYNSNIKHKNICKNINKQIND